MFQIQFLKIEPTTKITFQTNSSKFFHPKITKIYENIYGDPIQITISMKNTYNP
jgi:hypothetical protein